jgi:hypothetical protein
MNKVVLILIAGLISSCSSRSSYPYKKFPSGLRGLSYNFSDNGNRGLEIRFLTDTTLTVDNRSSVSHNYYLVSFNSKYLYRRNEVGTVIIQAKIDSNKRLRKSNIYRKPYDNRRYTMDSLAFQYVFPDIEGDTMRFSSDFKRLQIKEFCFERAK